MGSPLRSAAHVFVEVLDPASGDLVLSDEDRHHLERALRLRPGELVTASDGRGRWCPCRYAGAGRLAVDGPVSLIEPAAPAITIGFAVTKGERPEWVIQKLTEVGVDRIIPFLGARSVARWDGERANRHVERLRAVGRSAAMQSRRVWLPEIEDVSTFAQLTAVGGSRASLAHPGGGAVSLAHPTILIGPEGGFSEAEVAGGLPAVDLGPLVLRAETAALFAGILLCALRVGLVATTS